MHQQQKPGLPLREYQVTVLVVPPRFTGVQPYRVVRVITGRSLKDAKKRAGMQ